MTTESGITTSSITYDVLNSTIQNTNTILLTILIIITPIAIVSLKGLVEKWFKL